MKEKSEWTGNIIGRMHSKAVTRGDLANEMGVSKAYISMLLNESRKPANAQEMLETAFQAVLAKRTE